jgi:hypothetical protein
MSSSPTRRECTAGQESDKMKTKLIVAIMLVLCLASTSLVSAAAQKMDLFKSGDQFGPNGSVSGFSVFNNPTGKLLVTVSLKAGAANTLYGVYLETYSDPTTWIAYQYLGDLTTNKQGNGNFEAQLPLLPGTYYVQIAVGAGWDFKTNVATIVIR